ncbi:MAG: tRNA lysidine(34) synthetase TilS [Candidatus Rokubacteria bacterium]|nr:tRNA lysidine(34) synthetase TilS [Candidatus Rokubacteria bacterium]
MTTGTELRALALDSIRRSGMLRGGEAVLVAVSGGADSVALLDVLGALAPELRLTLQVVHVHHGLRPEADADAGFAGGLCARLGIPFHLERVSVTREPPWDGLEAEARRARYGAFREVARRVGAQRVATAHTADDQAETVLMRLLEGAGPRGLAGIAPVRGIFIRPFLGARRADIEAHLRARGLAWVEDASNSDPRFLRNRIRHEVLPFLAEAVEPGLVEHLARSAALVRAMVDDLERVAARELPRLGRRGAAGWVLSVADLAGLPGEAAAETVRQAARDLGHSGALRGHAQKALRGLLVPGARRGALRSGGVIVERSGRWLRVGQGRLPALAAHEFPVPGELPLPEVGLVLDARCFDRAPGYAAPREAARAAFDADLLPSRLHVRGRRRGDRFAPFGGPAERRLKSFLIDAGVPRWERDRVPLVEAGGDIIWVAGLRRGQAAPVGPGTRRILEVTLRSPLAGHEAGE